MKSNLMKRILSICFSAFVLVSCQKEVSQEAGGGGGGAGGGGGGTGGGGGYYLKAKVGGTQKNFNNLATLMISELMPGVVSVNIIGGFSATSLEGVNLGINFSNGGTFSAGTYSENSGSLEYVVGGVYNPGSQTITYGAGIHPNPEIPLEIKITSLDSKEAKGSFKGSFFKLDINNPGAPQTEYINITEGEFFLKVTK